MSLIDILLLAIALGIDCLVVSFSQGLIFSEKRLVNSLRLAVTMGLFQGIMPCIGYIGANYIYNFVEPYSRWLVCAIFLILGLKFIMEAFSREKQEIRCIGLRCLISLGIATSIDALVAGASINLMQSPLKMAAITIGIVSFFMSMFGFWLGNSFKKFSSKYLEILGGLILVFLAFKAIIF